MFTGRLLAGFLNRKWRARSDTARPAAQAADYRRAHTDNRNDMQGLVAPGKVYPMMITVLKQLMPGRMLLAVILLAGFVTMTGCAAFPHKVQREYPSHSGLSVGEATRMAALSMQDAGFFPEVQNESSGFVAGKMNDPDLMGFAQTFTMVAEVGRNARGPLWVKATCKAGPEVAISTSLPGYVKKFFNAFEKRLQIQAPPQRPAPAPVVTPPAPSAPRDLSPPEASPPASVEKTKEYDL